MSYCYIPNPEAFKHFKYGKYKIDFFKQTAIIMWPNTVNEDYDEKTSYKATKTAILDALRDNPILSTKFILINEKYDKKDFLELYVNFKRNNLATRDKKAEIRRFIDNIQKR